MHFSTDFSIWLENFANSWLIMRKKPQIVSPEQLSGSTSRPGRTNGVVAGLLLMVLLLGSDTDTLFFT